MKKKDSERRWGLYIRLFHSPLHFPYFHGCIFSDSFPYVTSRDSYSVYFSFSTPSQGQARAPVQRSRRISDRQPPHHIILLLELWSTAQQHQPMTNRRTSFGTQHLQVEDEGRKERRQKRGVYIHRLLARASHTIGALGALLKSPFFPPPPTLFYPCVVHVKLSDCTISSRSTPWNLRKSVVRHISGRLPSSFFDLLLLDCGVSRKKAAHTSSVHENLLSLHRLSTFNPSCRERFRNGRAQLSP
jgi:hypothetical protein